jgi:Cu+-exporting ATPase
LIFVFQRTSGLVGGLGIIGEKTNMPVELLNVTANAANINVRKLVMSIEGMTCTSCSNTVEAALKGTEGVLSATVALATNRGTVEYNSSIVKADTLVGLLDDIGFGGSIEDDLPVNGAASDAPKPASPIRKLVVSIEGMTCSSCSSTVEAAWNGTPGVLSAMVVLATNKGVLEYNESVVKATTLVELLEDIGFGGNIEDDAPLVDEKAVTGQGAPKVKKLIMKCETEVEASTKSNIVSMLQSTRGVASAKFVDSVHIQISFNDDETGPRFFFNILAGFGVKSTAIAMGGFMSAGKMNSQRSSETQTARRAFLTGLLFTLPLILLSDILPMTDVMKSNSPLYKQFVPGLSPNSVLLLILSTPVQWVIGWRFHKKALHSIVTRSLGMDFLVSTGTSCAYVYSLIFFINNIATGVTDVMHEMKGLMYFETAAVLITVVLLGKFLESFARGRTASAIESLTALRPKTARIVGNVNQHVLALEGVSNKAHGRYELCMNDEENQANGENSSGNSAEVLVDSCFIHKGDILRVLEGDSIAADGVVITTNGGNSSGHVLGVDESMITGESRVVKKRFNDPLYGGTTCVEGSAEMRVTACGDDSVLGKIVSTVMDAQASKPPIQEVADTVARYFVPLIAIISVCTLIIWSVAWLCNAVPVSWYGGSRTNLTSDRHSFFMFAGMFALSVWVSACPCAFGLATPTAVLVSTGLAAQFGVLVRKGAAIQFAAEVDTVCFDKTGTLTCGKTAVSDFVIVLHRDVPSIGDNADTKVVLVDAYEKAPLDPQLRADHATLIHVLLSAELQSNHPLAVGIAQFCSNRLSDLSLSTNAGAPLKGSLVVVPGQGILFTADTRQPGGQVVGETVVLVGSPVLMASNNVPLAQPVMRAINGLRAGGKVAMLVAVNNVVCAVIGVSDMVRQESAAVVESLRRRGITSYMITGDAESTAHAIGAVVGIEKSHIFAGTKPKDKETIVAALVKNGKKVAFVGDGTNDSPALARASVGIAMSSGSSIAIESGDMVLCNNDLHAVVIALDLSVKTMRRIKLNYLWALVYNACLVPVAAGIFVPSFQFALAPTMAGMAMAASSVSIVVSSLLLQLYTPPPSLIPVKSESSSHSTIGSEDSLLHTSSSPQASPKGHGLTRFNSFAVTELAIEKCNCPVSTAPKFQLTEPTLSEQLWDYVSDAVADTTALFTAGSNNNSGVGRNATKIIHGSTRYSPLSSNDGVQLQAIAGDDVAGAGAGTDVDENTRQLLARVERALDSPRMSSRRSRSSKKMDDDDDLDVESGAGSGATSQLDDAGSNANGNANANANAAGNRSGKQKKKGSCSCGKSNCRCGEDCQCGVAVH